MKPTGPQWVWHLVIPRTQLVQIALQHDTHRPGCNGFRRGGLVRSASVSGKITVTADNLCRQALEAAGSKM